MRRNLMKRKKNLSPSRAKKTMTTMTKTITITKDLKNVLLTQ